MTESDPTGPPCYDSRALLTADWLAWQTQDCAAANGFEYRLPEAGVVYLRRWLSGARNTTSPGWRR